jgi:hypothetical protein
MNITVTQWAPLSADNITTHMYEDGTAYIELGTRTTPGQEILLWVGKSEGDAAKEAAALRKLAQVAAELADVLERRAVTS